MLHCDFIKDIKFFVLKIFRSRLDTCIYYGKEFFLKYRSHLILFCKAVNKQNVIKTPYNWNVFFFVVPRPSPYRYIPPYEHVKYYGLQERWLQWRSRRSERDALKTCFTCSYSLHIYRPYRPSRYIIISVNEILFHNIFSERTGWFGRSRVDHVAAMRYVVAKAFGSVCQVLRIFPVSEVYYSDDENPLLFRPCPVENVKVNGDLTYRIKRRNEDGKILYSRVLILAVTGSYHTFSIYVSLIRINFF